jgi:hypothetical protein
VRHHRLFAAGLAAALMLGAAAPALAAPGKAKGKANAPGQTKTKPNKPTPKPKKAKKTKSGVSGGGVVNGAEFSIQARLRDVRDGSASKGHFNYTDATTKVRCRGFVGFAETTPTEAFPRTRSVIFNNCRVNDQPPPGQITVEVVDGGQPPSVTPAGTDSISFSLPNVVTPFGGTLTDGNVKIR